MPDANDRNGQARSSDTAPDQVRKTTALVVTLLVFIGSAGGGWWLSDVRKSASETPLLNLRVGNLERASEDTERRVRELEIMKGQVAEIYAWVREEQGRQARASAARDDRDDRDARDARDAARSVKK